MSLEVIALVLSATVLIPLLFEVVVRGVIHDV